MYGSTASIFDELYGTREVPNNNYRRKNLINNNNIRSFNNSPFSIDNNNYGDGYESKEERFKREYIERCKRELGIEVDEDTYNEIIKYRGHILSEPLPKGSIYAVGMKKVKKDKKKKNKSEKSNKKVISQGELLRRQAEAREKEARKHEAMRKQSEIIMIQLISKRDMLLKKLNKLDISSKKEAKMIAAINIELRNIENEMNSLESKYGVHIDSIRKGSRVKRFLNRIKQKGKKIIKKVKRFVSENQELIGGILVLVLPTVFTFAGKLLSKLINNVKK